MANVVQISPTGSGKTYAYGLPLLWEAAYHTHGGVTGVVLVPTRELARQVQTSLRTALGSVVVDFASPRTTSAPPFARADAAADSPTRSTRCVTVVAWYGGIPKQQQWLELQHALGDHDDTESSSTQQRSVIVTATTGRLLDLLQEKSSGVVKQVAEETVTCLAKRHQNNDTINGVTKTSYWKSIFTQNLQTIVLDEADRLAMNSDLCEQTDTILRLLQDNGTSSSASPSSSPLTSPCTVTRQRPRTNCRKVLCSATWPDRASSAWASWVRRPKTGFETPTMNRATMAEPCIVIQVDAMTMNKRHSDKSSDPSQAQKSKLTTRSKGANRSVNCEQDEVDVTVEEEDAPDSESVMNAESEGDTPNRSEKGHRTDSGSKDLLLSRIPTNLTQTLHVCAEHKKSKKLLSTLEAIRNCSRAEAPHQRNRPRGIIFFAKIKTAQRIATFLAQEASQLGYTVTALHSQMSQPARERALQDFTCGKATILLATDIAARGIHANNVKFVINYDFPSNLEQYVHRCGRAGRGGLVGDVASDTNRNQGTVHSFFTRNLASLAPDLVVLLEASNQWIDPNLRLLVQDLNKKQSSPAKTQKRERSGGLNIPEGGTSSNDDWCADMENTNDPFSNLSSQKIVLKRALNVSDASDDEDSCNDFNDMSS